MSADQTQFGDFFNDMALHVTMTAPVVTALAGVPADEQDYIKYCDFLGHRLVSNVAMTVNGNPLDSYGSDVYNMHYQFCVPPNKRTGWLRNIGQKKRLLPRTAERMPVFVNKNHSARALRHRKRRNNQLNCGSHSCSGSTSVSHVSLFHRSRSRMVSATSQSTSRRLLKLPEQSHRPLLLRLLRLPKDQCTLRTRSLPQQLMLNC